MANQTSTAVVRVTLPSGPETQEFLAELTLDLGLLVRLLRGRVTERETSLVLEIEGDPLRVGEGVLRCKGRSPRFARAS